MIFVIQVYMESDKEVFTMQF